MHFVTIVEVNTRECGVEGREMRAKVYVTKAEDEEVIIGTNVLPQLGYQLTRMQAAEKASEGREGVRQNKLTEGRRLPTVATVACRSYIAPGTVQWVTLRGCESNANYLLDSKNARILSGVVRSSESGCVDIPVINRSSEPYVFKGGEEVGNWTSGQARLFYDVCARQLVSWVALKQLPANHEAGPIDSKSTSLIPECTEEKY
ncbi:unnamed protein product [Nippostrongylus brasiliensis]|uniref:ZP domain-containing protein n=1 Tax=Nippostrongylus brasiliensis TaxID=27835 RepID=A0A0N4YWX2_NIPBR|nr:unnamed protein product [Nippostrongylus brasiliensis]